jgi:hypothetical protein
VTVKDADPATVSASADPASSQVGSIVDVAALVENASGDPLDGKLVRYEVYKDTNADFLRDQVDLTGPGGAAFAFSGASAAAGGAPITAVPGVALLGPAEGLFPGYTSASEVRDDTVVVCVVPDFATSCDVATDGDDPVDFFTGENTSMGGTPTLPWDAVYVIWTA